MRLSFKDSALRAAVMATYALNPGTVLKSRFRIINDLGQGAFGCTYLASDLDRFEASCTVKQLRLDESANQELLTNLFQREARQLFSVGRHRHIPEFLGYFQDKGGHYLAYEYIKGDNLLTLLKQEYPWGPGDIGNLWVSMISALDHIHGLGLVHRDVKPSNIIKTRDPDGYTLIDFGASILHPAEPGTLIGTPGYTPLQQLVQGVANADSDRHALAMTLIHLLTGMPPSSLFELYGPNLRGLWFPSVLVSGVSQDLLNEIDSGLTDQISSSTIVDTAREAPSSPFSGGRLDEALPTTGQEEFRGDHETCLDTIGHLVPNFRPPQRAPEVSTIHDFSLCSTPLPSSHSDHQWGEDSGTTRFESRLARLGSSRHQDSPNSPTLHYRRIGFGVGAFVVASGLVSSLFCQGRWYCLDAFKLATLNLSIARKPSVDRQTERELTLTAAALRSGDIGAMLRAHYNLKKHLDGHRASMNASLLSRVNSELDRLQRQFSLASLLEYSDDAIVRARATRKRSEVVLGHEIYQSLRSQLRLSRERHRANPVTVRSIDQREADLALLPSPGDDSGPLTSRPEPIRPQKSFIPSRQPDTINPNHLSPPSPSFNVRTPPRAALPPPAQEPQRSSPSGSPRIYIEPVQGAPF